jgi:hypothetical protein
MPVQTRRIKLAELSILLDFRLAKIPNLWWSLNTSALHARSYVVGPKVGFGPIEISHMVYDDDGVRLYVIAVDFMCRPAVLSPEHLQLVILRFPSCKVPYAEFYDHYWHVSFLLSTFNCFLRRTFRLASIY